MSFIRRPLVQGILMAVMIVIVLSYLLSQMKVDNIAGAGKDGIGDVAGVVPEFEKEAISGQPGTYQILVVPIHGIIYRGEGSNSLFADNFADSDVIEKMLDQALHDDRIKAVVLEMNTPGGEVVATDMIYRKVRKLSESGKPVVAYLSVVAASGGYYIAAGADKIVAHPLCTTGSIGVIISAMKYFELQKKLGISSENYTTGKFKDILSGSRPTSQEEKNIIAAHLLGVYERFAEVVSKGRNIPVAKVKASPIGDGRIMLGSEAKKLKLVDENGTFEDALAAARKEAMLHPDCRVVRFRGKKKSFWEILDELSQVSVGNRKIELSLPFDAPETKIRAMGGRYFMIMN